MAASAMTAPSVSKEYSTKCDKVRSRWCCAPSCCSRDEMHSTMRALLGWVPGCLDRQCAKMLAGTLLAEEGGWLCTPICATRM